jgi:hypothetical protein
MVKAIRKPLEEIFEMVSGFPRVLTVACGGCTSVCLAGGQREALELNAELAECFSRGGRKVELDCYTTERQCSPDFVAEVAALARGCDCMLSTACGVGAQLLAETHPTTPVFPALNTMFLGWDQDVAFYQERCRTCGDCHLGWTGGVCPVTRCSKSLFNGPCGGTSGDGKCEVSPDTPCAWHEIYERLKGQNRLDSLLTVRPVMEWKDKGPASFVQRGYEGRYAR